MNEQEEDVVTQAIDWAIKKHPVACLYFFALAGCGTMMLTFREVFINM